MSNGMKKILNGKTFLLIAFLFIVASFVYSNYASNKANEGVEITKNIKGNPDAKVVLVEYSDFQCPACAQFQAVIKTLQESHSDLAVEYKHFPLVSIHSQAVPAAKAAEAAGQQGKFFEMHDKLFENQEDWSGRGNAQAIFFQYAEEIGLDIDLFKKHFGASLIEDKIKDEFSEAQQLGLPGTPSFFMNGEPLQYESFDGFIETINRALGISSNGNSTSTPEVVSSPVENVKFGF